MATLAQIRSKLHQQIAKLNAVVSDLLEVEADIDSLITPPPPMVLKSARGSYSAMKYSGANYSGGPKA